ncbi:hypothetical protein GCM10023149_18270 [Mucilaginibacter gynuensis]|uniref:Beta-galactosidase-like protein n=1 Tax=Mucilaginibacter gynuensis TaxID=1302236 RepID=A0ABP8G976_9SPHI
MIKKTTLLFTCCTVVALAGYAQSAKKTPGAAKEKTAFQTGSSWRPEIDVRSDIAIVYGANDHDDMTFEQRVKSWRDRGYQTDFMTGIAWGQYPDYFLGKWDGKNHLGIGQVNMKGDTIWHGRNIPYVVPVQSFIDYMKTAVIKKVIDAGITSIYLEEPEFWARGGYGEAFKEEWQKFYGFEWRAQHLSPENTYLSNKLKYQLFYNAIKEVSNYAKEYGQSKGLKVRVYIPTHSLVNYSSWHIVSPEASLASLPGIDGYIAQVWTGTSREPVFYEGTAKERVFENAFLEYGSMVSMTAPTNRKLFFLTDPIEDRARDWADYKRNYQATFIAKLLYPTVADYEVMPWPERIYTHTYKMPNTNERVLIPKYYSTQMQVMVNSLNNIPVSVNKVSGVNGIGVLMSNSLMFQNFPSHNGYDDPYFANFYGQAMPLLKRGVPVQTVHMENLQYPNTLKDIKVLVVSYSNMKPHAAEVHQHIADWVRKGGVLIYCGRDNDPFQTVMEWWDTKDNSFKAPSEHLFKLLNIEPSLTDDGSFKVGKGMVHVIRKNPKEFVMQKNGGAGYLETVKQAYEKEAKGGELQLKNSLYLERGAYDIAAVMDESVDAEPLTIYGPVIDLFDPQLPVLTEKVVKPGEQAYLYNVSRIENKKIPQVVATAARIYKEENKDNNYTFIAKSPIKTLNAMRIYMPSIPLTVKVTDSKGKPVTDINSSWDAASKTYFLGFDNNPDGVKVSMIW